MNEKSYERLIRELKGSSAQYQAMQGHFQHFCAQAKRLAEARESPLTGQLRASMDGGALLLEFLDRRIRISMRYDRKAESGVLHAEDESATRPGRAPEILERVLFNENGQTEHDGGQQGKLTLGLPADCMTLLARLVDTALDRELWK